MSVDWKSFAKFAQNFARCAIWLFNFLISYRHGNEDS